MSTPCAVLDSEIIWLTYEQVTEIHQDQLELHGGTPGINDDNLIHGALAAPVHLLLYKGEEDILILAARLCQAIAKGHGWIDGNKRTATVAMLLFLAFNGFYTIVPENEDLQELAEWVEMLADSLIDYIALADLLRPFTFPIH
jgi:death-on-curing protein